MPLFPLFQPSSRSGVATVATAATRTMPQSSPVEVVATPAEPEINAATPPTPVLSQLSRLSQYARAKSLYKVSAHRPPPVGVAETGTERANSTDLAERGHFSRSTLAHADRENILARLAGLPPAIDSHGRRLLEYTCAFLQSDHWETAITKGWEMVELFGIHPYAPLVHVGCQGLVTGVALSAFPGAKVVEIADDHAVIRNRSGSTLTYRRCMPAMETAVLWWECRELINWGGES